MIAFLRRIWVFVKPYRSRLILGLVFGILYAAANSTLVVSMRVAMKLIFSEPGSVSLLDEINKAPKYLRPLIDNITPLLPSLSSPFSKAALIVAALTLTLSMLFPGLFA